MQKKDFNKIDEKLKKNLKENIGKVKNIVTFKTKHWIFFSIIAIIAGLMVYSYHQEGIANSFLKSDTSALSETIKDLGIVGIFVFVFLVVLEVLLAPIPGFILYITGGVVYGWIWGAVLTLVANMIGATLCFYLAKSLGREFVEKKVDTEKMKIFDKYALRFGGYAVFFLRINPFTSSDIVSYASGFANIRFRDFFLGTFLGLLPLSFAQTYFGYALSFSPTIYWIFVILSIIYFVAMIYLLYSKVIKESYKNLIKR